MIFSEHKLGSRLSALAAGAAVALAALLVTHEVQAQDARAPKADAIEFVVGSGAGATPDLFMRRIAAVLNDEKIVEQPITVQNRTGGGWTVATNYTLGKAGSEDVLQAVVGTVIATPIVQGIKAFIDQLTPIAMIMRIDLLVVVLPDAPYKNLAEFIEAAKQGDRTVAMGGANVGSTDSIVTWLIEDAGGVKINYVPFDGGGGPILSAFLSGTVQAITLPLDEAYPLIKAGKARPIAILSEQRRTEADFKDVPTAKEQGFDILWSQYFGVMGPPNLDPAVAAWWDQKLAQMVETDAWKKAMSENFLRTDYKGREEAVGALKDMNEQFRTILTQHGLAK